MKSSAPNSDTYAAGFRAGAEATHEAIYNACLAHWDRYAEGMGPESVLDIPTPEPPK